MSVKEKATAPVPSVGADGKQSLCKTNKESIADLPDKGNIIGENGIGYTLGADSNYKLINAE